MTPAESISNQTIYAEVVAARADLRSAMVRLAVLEQAHANITSQHIDHESRIRQAEAGILRSETVAVTVQGIKSKVNSAIVSGITGTVIAVISVIAQHFK